MQTLNIGILAHVDAGKTSLTERLLYNAGVIKTLGSVDQGNTQTDSLALERQRGITIKAAVTSFTVGDLKLNLIDTPGHPDFIAEVERSLRVLDAVVLVVSAVEGVQPQTRILFRALQRLHIPTLIFINKIDRMGARDMVLVQDIREKLSPHVVAMNAVRDIGTREVEIVSFDKLPNITTGQVGRMEVCPIFFGSAIQGVGVPELTKALETYFAPPKIGNNEPLSAVVFKIERGVRGEKIVFARMYSGELRLRIPVGLHKPETGVAAQVKITTMQTFKDGATLDTPVAQAGDIVKVWGLNEAAINDYIGTPPRDNRKPALTRASLESVVAALVADGAPKLFSALQNISEQDPFVQVQQNPHDKTLSVRLCGEVQKEVIEATLTNEYGINVRFSETTTICIERPIGSGDGLESGKRGDPYLGTVGLCIEPGSIGSGIRYQLATDVTGKMPTAFYAAIEETVPEVLRQGLYGWEVTDCVVTLTNVGYWPRQSHAHASFDKSMSSTASDFRIMTTLAIMQALAQARTVVCEPVNRFELDIPETAFAKVMQSLVIAEARLDRQPKSDRDAIHLEGLIPARRMFVFERQIPDLTGGEGVFVSELAEYQEVQGVPPTRARTDHNPLNRQEYLRRILNRT
ncbi:MAG TPA: translation factor GTPase family protein [Candidatus Saccharimonadales bacterium]|nr:translation factor GTPase family protein [Candidatus Saccharimonadales bacterium]